MFAHQGLRVHKICTAAHKLALRGMATSSQGSRTTKFPLEERFKKMLTPDVLEQKSQEFEKDGFTVLHELFEPETMDELREEMDNIITKAEKENFNDSAIFTTNKQIEHLSKSVDYFLDSASKVSFFYEKDAFDAEGKLVGPLNTSLNKVGHAMHDLNPVFHKFCYSNVVKTLAKDVLHFINPILVQTMYIFKSPKVGGEVSPHQDSTYLTSHPLSCKAIWVALDDATKENGCMWGIPGSHKTTPIDYFMKAQRKNVYDESGKVVGTESSVFYEPNEPPKYTIKNDVPLETKKGSVILFDGAFVHYSNHNHSDKRRHAFTIHMVESENTKWDEQNWLQRTPENPFRYMFEQNP